MLTLLLALLQDSTVTAPVPPDSILVIVLKAAGALLFPVVATFLAMQLSKLVERVNKMPDWEKRLIVAIYGIILTGISKAVGFDLPDAWGALSSPDIQAALTVGLAFVLHRFVKPKEVPTPVPVTVVPPEPEPLSSRFVR